MKKKIIVAIDGNVPSIKAHSITTSKMADALSRVQAFSVELVAGASFVTLKRRLEFKGIHKHYGIAKNVKLKFLYGNFQKEFMEYPIGIPGVAEKFHKFLLKEKERIKFVYARSFTIPLLCMELGIPVILETHAKEIENPDFKKVVSDSDDKNFLGIITIHENLKKAYIEGGVPKDKVLVCHDGFSSSLFSHSNREGVKKEYLTATYIGGLYKEKGIQEILEMAKLANDNNVKIHFQLGGGDKEQIEYWKGRAKEKGLTNLKFLGYLPNEKVASVLMNSDILMMPYPKLDKFDVMDINSTSPLKLFEYMAARKPILSTDLPVVSSVLTHNEEGYLAEWGNIDSHFQGLLKLVENVEFRGKIAENAYLKSKQYSWEERSRKLLNFVEGRC